MPIDVDSWPTVPRPDRPKKLYHNQMFSPEELGALEGKGWEVVDVRLLPSEGDGARASVLKCWLEGIRQGGIDGSPRLKDFLELEAKTCGLIGQKLAQPEQPTMTGESLEDLLDFTNKRAFQGRELDLKPKKKK